MGYLESGYRFRFVKFSLLPFELIYWFNLPSTIFMVMLYKQKQHLNQKQKADVIFIKWGKEK